MQSTILVVDDFLDNAMELREAALRLTYPQSQQGAFPGRNSLERITIDGLDRAASHLLNEPLVPVAPLQSHAKCRLTMAGDVGRGRVHIDSSHWSGILYLSRPEDCQGGTRFYRHLRTATDGIVADPAGLSQLGYRSIAEMSDDIIPKDGMDDAKWELTMEVPMRFNRLVLLRPWLWHTAGPGFGDRPENARLVYLLFFQSARARAAS